MAVIGVHKITIFAGKTSSFVLTPVTVSLSLNKLVTDVDRCTSTPAEFRILLRDEDMIFVKSVVKQPWSKASIRPNNTFFIKKMADDALARDESMFSAILQIGFQNRSIARLVWPFSCNH